MRSYLIRRTGEALGDGCVVVVVGGDGSGSACAAGSCLACHYLQHATCAYSVCTATRKRSAVWEARTHSAREWTTTLADGRHPRRLLGRYRRAAEQGDAFARCNLGIAYLREG